MLKYKYIYNVFLLIEEYNFYTNIRQKSFTPHFLRIILHLHRCYFLKNVYLFGCIQSYSCSTWDLRCGTWALQLWCIDRLNCSAACECRMLVPRPGIEAVSSALQGKFLTTGPLAKSPCNLLMPTDSFPWLLTQAQFHIPGRTRTLNPRMIQFPRITFSK